MIFSPAKLFFILIAIVCISSNNIFSQDLKDGEINSLKYLLNAPMNPNLSIYCYS